MKAGNCKRTACVGNLDLKAKSVIDRRLLTCALRLLPLGILRWKKFSEARLCAKVVEGGQRIFGRGGVRAASGERVQSMCRAAIFLLSKYRA